MMNLKHIIPIACALMVSSVACEDCAPPAEGEGEGDGEEGEGEGQEGEGEEGEGEGQEGEGEGEAGAQNACLPIDDAPDFAISSKGDLRWKRFRVVETDLMNALELNKAQVCNELGLAGFCYDLVHLVPLGGNSPVATGMYKPLAEPGVTMPLSFDRVALQGCGTRADIDALVAVDDRVIWRNIDILADSIAPDDAGLRADVNELYRRLLGRAATSAELDTVTALAEDVDGEAVSARDVAKLACYSIATTSEFIFH